MDRPTVAPETRQEYGLLATRLADELGATAGQMMGMPMLYLRGKGFAGLYGNAMVFKLEGAAHARALAIADATLFDPSGMGRPMKAWVQVLQSHSSEWADLARAAARGIAAIG